MPITELAYPLLSVVLIIKKDLCCCLFNWYHLMIGLKATLQLPVGKKKLLGFCFVFKYYSDLSFWGGYLVTPFISQC